MSNTQTLPSGKNPLSALSLKHLLLSVPGLLMLAILSRIAAPDLLWLSLAFVGLAGVAGLLAVVKGWGRSAAYGLNSAVTVVLVVSLLGVVNFMANTMLGKIQLDLTKGGLHTLSDQTRKVVQGLKVDVQAVLFAKFGEKEQLRPLLENFAGLSQNFKLEYVDPDKEPTRAKEAGIKKYGNLQLKAGGRTTLLDEVNEEKLTNALIKLTKAEAQVLCAITGHGEKDFESRERDGLFGLKTALEEQSYQVKAVNLPQEGSIPKDCMAIAIVGPSRSFFENEIKVIDDYLKAGGSALVAVDVSVKGPEAAPELLALLDKWGISSPKALIVDNNPVGRLMGMDASVPMIQTFSTDSPITKEVQTQAAFPFVRPVEIKAGTPAGMSLLWLAKTSPRSWGETDFTEIAGGVLKFAEGKDIKGPVTVAVTLEGKHPDAKPAPSKSTRLVVFGTSQFATNYFARFGGNFDLAVNSISWSMADDSLISIRKKEDGPSKVELTGGQQITIFWLVVVLIPLMVTAFGVFQWMRRRSL
ncbi:MAG: GldG family protein [Bdellovibrionales bacterium]|nr:GldG family protein [Bdellovibrionales bacterium]